MKLWTEKLKRGNQTKTRKSVELRVRKKPMKWIEMPQHKVRTLLLLFLLLNIAFLAAAGAVAAAVAVVVVAGAVAVIVVAGAVIVAALIVATAAVQ